MIAAIRELTKSLKTQLSWECWVLKRVYRRMCPVNLIWINLLLFLKRPEKWGLMWAKLHYSNYDPVIDDGLGILDSYTAIWCQVNTAGLQNPCCGLNVRFLWVVLCGLWRGLIYKVRLRGWLINWFMTWVTMWLIKWRIKWLMLLGLPRWTCGMEAFQERF